MSIVLAVKKNDDLVIATDTQQTFGSNTPCPGNIDESKILRIGPACLGSTGWGIYDNILTDFLGTEDAPLLSTTAEVFSFFKGLWGALHDKYSFVNDQSDDKDSPFGDLDSSFLIAVSNRIYYVSSNMTVTEFLKFHAIGSGCEYAIGAMFALYDTAASAEDIARKGVESAMIHDVYCGGAVSLTHVG